MNASTKIRSWVARLTMAALATVAMMGWSSSAAAAWTGTMEVQGETQGKLEGSAPGKQIRVIAFEPKLTHRFESHGVFIGATPQHPPVLVTVAVDRATPLLMNALIRNERLSKVVVHLFAPDPSGGTREIARLELRDARLAKFALDMDSREVKARHSDDLLTLELTYETAVFTWIAGSQKASLDARVRNGPEGAAAPPPTPKSSSPPSKARKTGTTKPAPPKPRPRVRARRRPRPSR